MLFYNNGNMCMSNIHKGREKCLLAGVKDENVFKALEAGAVPTILLGEGTDCSTQFEMSRDEMKNTTFLFFKNLPGEFKPGDYVPLGMGAKVEEDTYFTMAFNKAESCLTLIKCLEAVYRSFSESERNAAEVRWQEITEMYHNDIKNNKERN